ncbi:MAG: LysR family transcriptional regulator ArgP [Solirubrobacterales bacterium]
MAFRTEHLETLVVLVDEGSFDKAARRLQVTSSAVSQRIKAMEQSAGQVLVQRTIPVEATAAGDVALRFGRQMMLLEAQASKALDSDPGGGTKTTIPLAINADSLATWFLDALAPTPETEGVLYDILREDQEHTVELLRAGKVMAAVTSNKAVVQGCKSEVLGVMRYHAISSPDFLAKHLDGEATAESLDRAPVVNFDRKDDLQHRFFREFAGHHTRSPRHYVPTSNAFLRAVHMGLGWGLLPEQQCLESLESGQLVDLIPDRIVDVPLYWQRWTLSTPVLEALTDKVKQTAARELLPFTG